MSQSEMFGLHTRYLCLTIFTRKDLKDRHILCNMGTPFMNLSKTNELFQTGQAAEYVTPHY